MGGKEEGGRKRNGDDRMPAQIHVVVNTDTQHANRHHNRSPDDDDMPTRRTLELALILKTKVPFRECV
jgi:hypothetical protein